ncbi:hypothetical protein IE81DRAFT_235341 [Ceraceosorus guamensis]|uniref:N-acetyltransferase domain-containing protein n=1 Tax=Ceraceosorus guamensis TaxID=1522189 RepID=A0A316VV87_9BASI|nr:hypothetical protein IE81DRAFT_235341 [Ceraceosorus guamensis]PWN40211.1 hypothetical protein IE81DRAFT_235341 [Ceraceosorus guamensis]
MSVNATAYPLRLHSDPQETLGGFEIDTSRDRMPWEVVWNWLHTKAYWGQTRTRAQFEIEMPNSYMIFGLYDVRERVESAAAKAGSSSSSSSSSSKLAGFTRIISDGASFGYLSDVFLLEEYQKLRLGTPFMRHILDADGRDRWRWVLHASHADTWYQDKFGFKSIGITRLKPEDKSTVLMERDGRDAPIIAAQSTEMSAQAIESAVAQADASADLSSV